MKGSRIVGLCALVVFLWGLEPDANAQIVQYFPQLADGGGYTTTWYFGGLGTSSSTVKLELFRPDGNPLILSTTRGSASSFAFDLGGFAETSIQTLGQPAVQVGWAKVTSSQVIGTTEVFQTVFNGQVTGLTGVMPSDPTDSATVFVSINGRGRNTGLALANVGSSSNPISLTLYNQSGGVIANSSLTLAPRAQIARFIDELPGFERAGAIEGSLSISGQLPVSAVTLLLDGSQLSTLPTLPGRVQGSNLIRNGNAEEGPASATGAEIVTIPGWTTTGPFTVVSYGTESGFPGLSDPGPVDRGKNFFSGGSGADSTASQRIDLSSMATSIAAGVVRFTLSGYIGGYLTQSDNAVLTASFRDAAGKALSVVSIGPVTLRDRSDTTGLLFRSATGTVPDGAKDVVLELKMSRFEGNFNDGYADNLSLVLRVSPN